MSPGSLQFLTGLPAILGVAGFAAYHLLRSRGTGDAVSRAIVEKLRTQIAVQPPSSMHPRDVRRWLESDAVLRQAVTAQDFHLLQQTLRQQHRESIVVYCIVSGLILASVGIYAYPQFAPKPLILGEFRLESVDPEAKGLAVDTDTLQLTWQAEGRAEDIEIALQNVQTKRTTSWIAVSSAQQTIAVAPEAYAPILSERARGGFNRLRALIRVDGETRVSSEFRLNIGITIVAYFDPEDDQLCVTALIDNRAIPYYTFEAKVLLWTRDPKPDLRSFGDQMSTPKTCFTVREGGRLRWSDLRIAYFGPDDDRVVRTSALVDEGAIAAAAAKKTRHSRSGVGR